MQTKDQIIDELSNLIRELLRVGMDKYQKVMDLFCKIQKLLKDKDEVLLSEFNDQTKIVVMQEHRVESKQQRLCPKCKTNYRKVLKSGRVASYCTACNSFRIKEKRGMKV